MTNFNVQDISKEAYTEQLSSFVRGFIDDEVLPHRAREDIRAIVVAGEASASAIAELTAITHDAVGTDVVKVMSDIDPSEVAAHGAAAMVR
jgi:hypothetical protein